MYQNQLPKKRLPKCLWQQFETNIFYFYFLQTKTKKWWWRPVLRTHQPVSNRQCQPHRNRLVKVVRTSICGNFSKNCWPLRNYMGHRFVGWIDRRVSSKSKIQYALPGYGDDEKIVRQWTTINCHGRFDSITKRVSWKKQNAPNDWSTNFVIHIVYKIRTLTHIIIVFITCHYDIVFIFFFCKLLINFSLSVWFKCEMRNYFKLAGKFVIKQVTVDVLS